MKITGREMPPKPPPACDDCKGAGTKINSAGKLYPCPTCNGTGTK